MENTETAGEKPAQEVKIIDCGEFEEELSNEELEIDAN